MYLYSFSLLLTWYLIILYDFPVKLADSHYNLATYFFLYMVSRLSHTALREKFVLQSILNYNGGCVVAMKGKNCVAIACDLRFGVQAQTISTDFEVQWLYAYK